ncbi:MAG: 3-oxoacyl-ACP synthase [Halieaceae bacterium]|nr:3-oxoacyl-ACP synthase [Halieaceae bacterium]
MSETGITGFGGYIPRRRIHRQAIAEAHSWAIPGLKGLGRGERSFCGHDEDVVTMAVAAARFAMAGTTDATVQSLLLASTTLPFADRQNSTLVGEALGLSEDLHTADVCGSQRAGTSALLQALRASSGSPSVVIASEQGFSKPGSVRELTSGDGAAAVLLGGENIVARLLGSHTVSRDLVDHYRSTGSNVDYMLEERWIRDEGYLKIIPDTVQRLFSKTGVVGEAINHFVVPVVAVRTAQQIARACGIEATAVADNLQGQCGDTGAAHALLMLVNTLHLAQPGDKILVLGFGQGCDALLFEATPAIDRAEHFRSIQDELNKGSADSNYMRFLSHNGAIEMDWGIRAERDTRTALSALYRNRSTFTGFVGGRCTACETVQFPKTKLCVNPDCNKPDTQVEEAFRDKTGHIKSFTEDWLGHSVSPPFMYGAVRFEGKASLMMELADFDPGQVKAGDAVCMSFRIKDKDAVRDFRRYFWKAVPARSSVDSSSEGE